MNDELTTQLVDALSEKKFPEAKEMLSSFFTPDLTSYERGQIYTGVLTAYVDSSLEAQKNYAEALKEGIAVLKQVKLMSSKIDDNASLLNIRKSLKG